jgi:hypothetical protein
MYYMKKMSDISNFDANEYWVSKLILIIILIFLTLTLANIESILNFDVIEYKYSSVGEY